MTKVLKPRFHFPFNLAVYNRVRGWMRNNYAENFEQAEWRLSAKHSGMCQLNSEIDLRDFLRTDITVTDSGNGIISVTIPALNPRKDIRAPLRTLKINISMIAVTSPFRVDPYPFSQAEIDYTYDYKDALVPAQTFELKTKGSPGDIAITTVGIEYETSDSKEMPVTDIRWMPAAIVAMGKLV